MDLTKQAAKRLMALKKERDQYQEKVAELEQKLAEYERRQQAENILLEARDCDDAPDRMKAASIERFLGLRAEFEDKEDSELEKVAMTVSMWNDEDGGIVPSEFPDHDDPSDFNEWIKSKMTV